MDTGLDKLGYEYVNMDDCWAQGRHLNGTIYPDPVAFPDGVAAVANYVHSLGLKFGLYTDRGLLTCAGRPGSFGFEEIDARTYAEWGVDYLKEDSCFAPSSIHSIAFAEYGTCSTPSSIPVFVIHWFPFVRSPFRQDERRSQLHWTSNLLLSLWLEHLVFSCGLFSRKQLENCRRLQRMAFSPECHRSERTTERQCKAWRMVTDSLLLLL